MKKKVIISLLLLLVIGIGVAIFFLTRKKEETPLQPFSGKTTETGTSETKVTGITEAEKQTETTEINTERTETEKETEKEPITEHIIPEVATESGGSGYSALDNPDIAEKITKFTVLTTTPDVEVTDKILEIANTDIYQTVVNALTTVMNYDGYTDEWYQAVKAFRCDKYDSVDENGKAQGVVTFQQYIRNCFKDRQVISSVQEVVPVYYQLYSTSYGEWLIGYVYGYVRCDLSIDGQKSQERCVDFVVKIGRLRDINDICVAGIELKGIYDKIDYYLSKSANNPYLVGEKIDILESYDYDPINGFSRAEDERRKKYEEQIKEYQNSQNTEKTEE